MTVVSSRLLQELLELQEQQLGDLVTIESDGRPVDRLSPGGRSSAMLPLIAPSDDVPLIIDQPEDNLDNRMVGQTLSLILERLKERRQIIVTTHNPNIVVGGNAEQAVVLDAVSDREARVETTGSIDQGDVIDPSLRGVEGKPSRSAVADTPPELEISRESTRGPAPPLLETQYAEANQSIAP